MPAAGQHGTGVPRTIPKASGAVAGPGDGELGTTPRGKNAEGSRGPGGGARKDLAAGP